jgi:hypothetical protein
MVKYLEGDFLTIWSRVYALSVEELNSCAYSVLVFH